MPEGCGSGISTRNVPEPWAWFKISGEGCRWAGAGVWLVGGGFFELYCNYTRCKQQFMRSDHKKYEANVNIAKINTLKRKHLLRRVWQ